MRNGHRARLILAVCAGTAVSMGCSKMPACNVSPVEIEELKEDITLLDKDLAGVQERVKQLSDELASKQADLEAKRPKPDELRRRLDQLKRGSGRIEKPKAADTKTPEAKPVPGKENS